MTEASASFPSFPCFLRVTSASSVNSSDPKTRLPHHSSAPLIQLPTSTSTSAHPKCSPLPPKKTREIRIENPPTGPWHSQSTIPNPKPDRTDTSDGTGPTGPTDAARRGGRAWEASNGPIRCTDSEPLRWRETRSTAEEGGKGGIREGYGINRSMR